MRCYCNLGRAGQYCQDVASRSSDNPAAPIIGLLAFVLIAIIAIGAVVFLIMKFVSNQKVAFVLFLILFIGLPQATAPTGLASPCFVYCTELPQFVVMPARLET